MIICLHVKPAPTLLKENLLKLARTMTYNEKHPVVILVKGVYEKGVKLSKKAQENLETLIERISGLEKWAVDISY